MLIAVIDEKSEIRTPMCGSSPAEAINIPEKTCATPKLSGVNFIINETSINRLKSKIAWNETDKPRE